MQVPVLSTPNVSTRPLEAPRVGTDTFGGAPAVPDASGLTDAVHDIYQEQKRKTDQVAVLSAAGQVSGLENSLATHARTQMGTNAYALPDTVSAEWQKHIADIGNGLNNDEQRLAFNNVVQSHWNSLDEIVQNHVADQHKVVDKEATDGYMANEADAAISNYTNPLRVGEAIANQAAAIRGYGERNGQDPAYIQAHVAEMTSKMHVAVIDRMLANVSDGEQPQMAKSYYDAFKSQIVGPEAARVDSLIGKKSVEGTAQQQADAIKKQATTLQDGLQQAAMIQDPIVRDKVEERLRRSFEDEATSRRQVREQNRVQASTLLQQNGGNFDALPITLRDTFTAPEVDGLKTEAKLIRNPQRPNNPSLYNSLVSQAALSPDAFKKLRISDYMDKLSQPEFEKIQDRWYTLHHQETTIAGSEGRREDHKAETAADKAAAQKVKDDKARELLKSLGVNIGPAVPGAPIIHQPLPGQQPTKPPAVDPSIAKLKVPDSWKQHAATDSAFAAYLKAHSPHDDEDQQ